MKAFELVTKVTNTGGLEIPASFLEGLPPNQTARILILVEEQASQPEERQQQYATPENSNLNQDYMEPPQIDDPAEREKILSLVAENMQRNPISPKAPQLTREMLHER